jgi:hypothetical protein
MGEFLQYQIAINIAEASDTDRIDGMMTNAEYGLALAASTTDMMPWVIDNTMVFPYTKGWFDACEPCPPLFHMICSYGHATRSHVIPNCRPRSLCADIAWNLNFVTSLGSTVVFPKLFIPSVMCTTDQNVRNLWLHSRVMSLKSTIAVANLVWSPPAGQQGRLRAAESQLTATKVARDEAAKARCA